MLAIQRIDSKLIYCRHDVGLQVVGQPARDLARHFIQRYDYDHYLFVVYYLSNRQMELSAENQGLYMSGSVSSGHSVMVLHRITRE